MRKITFCPKHSPRKATICLAGLVCLALCWQAIALLWNHVQAEAACPTRKNSTLIREQKPSLSRISRALAKEPKNPELYAKKGRAYLRMTSNRPISIMYRRALKEARRAFEAAVRLNPVSAENWHALSRCYAKQAALNKDQRRKWLHRADLALEAAVTQRPHSPLLLRLAGRYWVWRSTHLPPSDVSAISLELSHSSPLSPELKKLTARLPQTREQGIAKFQALYRRCLNIRQGRRAWKKIVKRIRRYYDPPQIVRGVIPPGNAWVRSKITSYLDAHPS